MRVGFDGRWYNHSGVGIYVYGLARAMREYVPDLDFIIYEYEDNPLPDLGRPYERRIVKKPKYSVAGQLEIAGCCKHDKLDVFHAPFYLVPVLASCPIIVTIHDLMPFLFRIYSWPHQMIVKMGYRMAAKRAARIIAVSRHSAGDLQRIMHIPAERISAISHGPLHSFTPGATPSEQLYLAERYGIKTPYVLTLSFTNWKTKNVDVALKAMLAAAQMGAAFQPVVVGAAIGLANCAEEVSRLKPLVTGYVPFDDLPMLYRNAAVFVCASAYEGLGMPVLEAMASGCAVVTSSGGSLPEVAGPGAVLVPTGDADAMGSAIYRLLSDDAERRRVRCSGIRRAEQFSWREVAYQTRAVYEAARRQRVLPLSDVLGLKGA